MNDYEIELAKKRLGHVVTPLTDEQILSLLARLEVAEALVINLYGKNHTTSTLIETLYTTWRKVVEK